MQMEAHGLHNASPSVMNSSESNGYDFVSSPGCGGQLGYPSYLNLSVHTSHMGIAHAFDVYIPEPSIVIGNLGTDVACMSISVCQIGRTMKGRPPKSKLESCRSRRSAKAARPSELTNTILAFQFQRILRPGTKSVHRIIESR